MEEFELRQEQNQKHVDRMIHMEKLNDAIYKMQVCVF